MAQQAPLEQLAAQLYASAQTITQYCKKEHHPQKSWDHVEPQTLLPPNAPQSILTAQQSIHEAATKIQRLVNDPADFLASFQVQVSLELPTSRLMCYSRLTFSIVPAARLSSLAMPLPYSQMHSSDGLCTIPDLGHSCVCPTQPTQIHRPHGHDCKLPPRACPWRSCPFEHFRRYDSEPVAVRLGPLHDVHLRDDGFADRRSD